jgi:Tol biopolymer transport system component
MKTGNVMIGSVGATENVHESNGTKYYSVPFTVKNSKWTVLFVWGKLNYVSVKKVSNNPYGSAGKEFKNIDQALEAYKMPEMKNQLIQSEFRAKKFGYKSK